MTTLLTRLREWLSDKLSPPMRLRIPVLIQHMVGLELRKWDQVTFAPLPGCQGPFIATGTFLPVFRYYVFDHALMEFIEVRVELANPGRIEYSAKIESTDQSADGRDVDVLPAYRRPFEALSLFLYQYFPYISRTYVAPKYVALNAPVPENALLPQEKVNE